jgi:hypothetical protein
MFNKITLNKEPRLLNADHIGLVQDRRIKTVTGHISRPIIVLDDGSTLYPDQSFNTLERMLKSKAAN